LLGGMDDFLFLALTIGVFLLLDVVLRAVERNDH
jgi:hypothetical protein